MEKLIRQSDAIKHCRIWRDLAKEAKDKEGWWMADNLLRLMKGTPTIEPNLLICHDHIERGEVVEIGEDIVVMHHDDYYDMLTQSMEREHGEWIRGTEHKTIIGAEEGELITVYALKCSHCGAEFGILAKEYDFCPSCGADMRRGANDEHDK